MAMRMRVYGTGPADGARPNAAHRRRLPTATTTATTERETRGDQVLAERRARGEAIEDAAAPSDEAVLLTEMRDLLATRS
jgi:hypothetical protein